MSARERPRSEKRRMRESDRGESGEATTRKAPADVRNVLEILRTQPCLSSDPREHSRADLVPIMKGEDELTMLGLRKHPMGTSLPDDDPAVSRQSCEDSPGLEGGPGTQAARKVRVARSCAVSP